MSFTLAMVLKPLVFTATIAALAAIRRVVERCVPESRLKRILLT